MQCTSLGKAIKDLHYLPCLNFPIIFFLSLLSCLASLHDISTLSSKLSLAFPLPSLLASSVFHPPWCLPAQRAAPRLSPPKQAAFVF